MRVTSDVLLDSSSSSFDFFTHSSRISNISSKTLNNAISECSGRFRSPKQGPFGSGEKELIIHARFPLQIVVSLYQILSSLETDDIEGCGSIVVWVVGINVSEIKVAKIAVLHPSCAAHGHKYFTLSPWNSRWYTSIQEFGNTKLGHYRFCGTRKIQLFAIHVA